MKRLPGIRSVRNPMSIPTEVDVARRDGTTPIIVDDARDNLGSSSKNVPTRIVRRLRRDVPLAALDFALVFPAYMAPLLLRFDGRIPERYWHNYWVFVPIAACLHVLANHSFGLYGQMWRYASIQEARRLVLAGVTAFVLIVAGGGIIVFQQSRPIPLSTVMLGNMIAIAAFGAIRFQSRLFGFRRRSTSTEAGSASRTILIMGAGDAGEMVLRDVLTNPELRLDPVGLIDDDPRKLGLSVHGVQVLGSRGSIPHLVERSGVDEVLLAIPSATSALVRDVAAICERADTRLRVLPSVRDIVGGRVAARDLRDLQIEDLLGRQQVATDLAAVRALITGRRVLITGAGGSIGSEIARQVADFEPVSLILLDRDETYLHNVNMDLGDRCPTQIVLGDVRDRRIMDEFVRLEPELVFHAAALKHVPVLEGYPREATLTNVIGTANVLDASTAAGADRFVLISSDKAINPVSVMGATKRLAEQIVRSAWGDLRPCVVRFGNVLGSRGSVIPTFLRQIESGGPVTITDPSMTRYFMSVQEAVQLVLQAAALSDGGEIYTLEMGEQVNILELARNLIRLSGRVPGSDVPIVVTGIRPGEKLAEELEEPDVASARTRHPGIRVASPPPPDRIALRRRVEEIEHLLDRGEPASLLGALLAGGATGPRMPVMVGGGS